MDFPASGQALWSIYDATGIRPEWLLPVLDSESGLNPAIPNQAGYPYYGLNQISGTYLSQRGVDPQDYLTWSASQQLSQIIQGYLQAQVNTFGPLRSGIRVYQSNFYPASLAYAKGLDDAIVSAPSAAYEANKVFDTAGKGYISPRDLGTFVAKFASSGAVQSALSQTYALRSSETPEDPVYGEDFGGSSGGGAGLLEVAVVAGSMLFLGAAAVSYFKPTLLPRWARVPLPV